VATGPGSFTGLRVGVTTAKIFAYSVAAAVLGVNTLDVIAAQATVKANDLWTVMDAQREQVFASHFQRNAAGNWTSSGFPILLDNSAWIAQLAPGQTVSGPGLIKLAQRLPAFTKVVDRECWSPQAEIVGQLAWKQFQLGRRDNVFTLAPQYFRPSA